MSWEHFECPIVCQDCGHKGSRIYSENDWFQNHITWIGFEFHAVPTKKQHTGNITCKECGSSSIQINKDKGQYVSRNEFGMIGLSG